MKNSDRYFENVKRFEEKRQEIISGYERTVEDLQKYQGSRFFEDEVQKAKDARDAALADLRREYDGIFTEALRVMRVTSDKRKAQAPTAEQLRILEVLKMRDSVTRDEIEAAANAMKGNLSALKILTELAAMNNLRGVMRMFDGPMARSDVEDVLASLEHGTRDLLEHDTRRSARIVQAYRQRVYGGASDAPLPKRKPIETKAGCFGLLASLNPDCLDAFCAAVDGEGDQDGEE